MAQPTFQFREQSARGPTSSSNVNNMHREIAQDMAKLFQDTTDNHAQLSRNARVYLHEAEALKARLANAEVTLAAYQAAAGNLDSIGYESFASRDWVLDALVTARVDSVHYECTLDAVGEYSRLFTCDTDGYVRLYPDLAADIGESEAPHDAITEGGGTITPGNPYLAMNGSIHTSWLRQVQSNTLSRVRCQLTLGLPPSNNPHVNRIYFHPLPEGRMTIVDVLYSTTGQEGSFTSLSAILDPNGAPIFSFPLQDVLKTQWCIPKTAMSHLRFVVETDHYTTIDGNRTFAYGAHEIGVWYTEWEEAGDIVFALPSTDPLNDLYNTITYIYCRLDDINPAEQVTPDPWDTKAYARDVRIRVYTAADLSASSLVFDSNATAYPNGAGADINVAAASTGYLWFRLTLIKDPNDGNTPVIKDLTCRYTSS